MTEINAIIIGKALGVYAASHNANKTTTCKNTEYGGKIPLVSY